MIESKHTTEPKLNIPIYSLYSEVRSPTMKMLKNVDTILIDLQTVGCRVYTFKYTMAACLRSAKALDKQVIILDRPNPLGGRWLEGSPLEPNSSSFVGEYSIPLRHGLTMGEAARLFNQEIGARLKVITMDGWNYQEGWDTKRKWVLPSPNLPESKYRAREKK